MTDRVSPSHRHAISTLVPHVMALLRSPSDRRVGGLRPQPTTVAASLGDRLTIEGPDPLARRSLGERVEGGRAITTAASPGEPASTRRTGNGGEGPGGRRSPAPGDRLASEPPTAGLAHATRAGGRIARRLPGGRIVWVSARTAHRAPVLPLLAGAHALAWRSPSER
jgi:hypothetical protein